MYNILICDDEKDIVSALRIYLSGEDYRIFEAGNGLEALEVVRREEIHLILMDVMTELGSSGLDAAEEIKKKYYAVNCDLAVDVAKKAKAEGVKLREISNAPILMLTAKSESGDKVLGLNIGADDYITKPFDPAEVLARVRSHLRRYTRLGTQRTEEAPESYTVGPITLDDTDKRVTMDGEDVALTPIEYNILRLLIRHPGRIYSTEQIYEQVWNETALGADNAVSVHIRHLRQKLEIDPSEPRYLKVVWGLGYKLEGGGQP